MGVKAVSCEEPKGNASDTAQCPSGYRYVAGARRYFGSGISVTKSVRLLRGCMDRLRVVSVVVGVVTVLDKYCRNGRSTLDSECRAMRRGLGHAAWPTAVSPVSPGKDPNELPLRVCLYTE